MPTNLNFVIDEKINNGHGNRAGYLVTINGLEAFLPCRLSYLPNDNIDHLINHNVLTTIEEIDGDKMSIILSMQLPYKELIADLPPPVNGEKTTGILTWVTLYNAYVLLTDETLGVIPQYRYPEKQPEYWEEQTGSLVDCIPYRKKFSSNPDNVKSFYVRLAGN